MKLVEKILTEAKNRSFPTLKQAIKLMYDGIQMYDGIPYPTSEIDDDDDDDLETCYNSKEDFLKDATGAYKLWQKITTGGFILIYRALKTGKINFSPDKIGESWTFSKESAIDFSNNVLRTGTPKMLQAKIDVNNVDWEATFERFAAYSMRHWSPENEVVVSNGNLLYDIKDISE